MFTWWRHESGWGRCFNSFLTQPRFVSSDFFLSTPDKNTERFIYIILFSGRLTTKIVSCEYESGFYIIKIKLT